MLSKSLFYTTQTTKLFFFYSLFSLYFKLAQFSTFSSLKPLKSLNEEFKNISLFSIEMNKTIIENFPLNLNQAFSNYTKNETTPNSPNEYTFIELFVFPVIIIIGTVCNFLTFLVMRRKKMQHQSTYFYMAVLAIADELVLLVGCLNTSLYAHLKTNILFLSEISCKLACLALYATFHFSVWVVVIMTIERFVAVAFPLQASRICTVRRAKIATMILAILILGINAHFLFTHGLQRNSEIERDECFATTDSYKQFMSSMWTWIDAVLYSFIPLTILIIFNILIVHNLVKAKNTIKKYNDNHINSKKFTEKPNNIISRNKELNSDACFLMKSEKNNKRSYWCISNSCCNFFRKKFNSNQSSNIDYLNFFKNKASTNSENSKCENLTINNYHQQNNEQNVNCINYSLSSNEHRLSQQSQQSQSQQSQSSYANRKLTIMLLVVSITFCLTSTPIVILQYLQMAGFFTESYEIYVIKGIFLSLQYLNHSVNFFLYAVTGKTFRREFYDMFSDCIYKKPKFDKAFNINRAVTNKTISDRYSNRTIKKELIVKKSLINQINNAVPLIKITEANSNQELNKFSNENINPQEENEESSQLNEKISETINNWDILISSNTSISYELISLNQNSKENYNKVTIV